MDSPRSGFRRATAASWALAGLGIAGVAGASALAYADTVQPPPAEPPTVVEQAAPSQQPITAPQPPVTPILTTTDTTPPPAPPPPPETTVEQAPVSTYMPEQTYIPETTAIQAPATHSKQAPTATAPRTTQRRALTPTTVMAPNFSPRISRSRGS